MTAPQDTPAAYYFWLGASSELAWVEAQESERLLIEFCPEIDWTEQPDE